MVRMAGKGMGPVTGGSPESGIPAFCHQGCLENQTYSQEKLQIEPHREVPHPIKNVYSHMNTTVSYNTPEPMIHV